MHLQCSRAAVCVVYRVQRLVFLIFWQRWQLLVPFYRRSTIGRRAFRIAGARIWNSLPSDVTSAPSLAVFGRQLKTELFRRCDNAA